MIDSERKFPRYQDEPQEPYMNPRQKEHFRQGLLQWRRELTEDIRATIDLLQNEVTLLPDWSDRASLESDMAIELRSRDREGKLIRKINDALARLDAGEYGFCEVCGAEIGLRRLEARPTATLCIDCKTIDEIKEKQVVK